MGISIAACRVAGTVLTALGSVWAARCLGPENLGISGMVSSAVQQAAILGGLISATVLVREYKVADRGERLSLVKASFTLQVLVAGAVTLLAIPVILSGVVPARFSFAAWLFIPLVLLGALQSANWVFQATEQVHFQSLLALISPGATALVYLAWFRPNMSAASDLVVSICVGLLMSGIYWVAVYQTTDFSGSPFSPKSVRSAMGLVTRSKWFYIVGIVMYAYNSLETPMLGYLRSVADVGLYRSAWTFTKAAQLFVAIVPSVLFPRFVEWQRCGPQILWRRQVQLASALALVGLLGTGLSLVVVPWLHPVIFGRAFAAAAWPSALLLVSQFILLLNTVFVWGVWADPAYDRRMAVGLMCIATASVALNCLLIPRWGMYATAAVHCLSDALILCFSFRTAKQKARVNSEKL